LASQALLITQGSFGMSLFDEEYYHIPVFGEDEVADVTGAGDTVAATVALCLGVGASFLEAAQIANRAAGLAVRRMGTAQVGQDELLATFGDEDEEGT